MTLNKKVQSLIFTFDQIMDSGLIFLFIALGGNLLIATEMANVVVAQSIALVCVLFCSCFTTQYLLLRYKNQTHSYWLKLLLFFVSLTAAIIVLVFKSPLILSLFLIGIASEFFKRYCYYSDKSFISGCAMLASTVAFTMIMLMAWFKIIVLDSKSYVYFYCLVKFIPLLVAVPFIKKNVDNKNYIANSDPFKHVIQDSFKLGAVFSIITIIYWVTNQGFFILFKSEIPAEELVKLRITQNVFGIVTMLITLYDSIFLKKNISNDKKIFNWKIYFHFIMAATGLVILNYVILYVLSITIYRQIDVFEYAFYFALGQLFYLFARMPILILKLRYNLTLILMLYLVSLFMSLGYLLINKNNSDFQYIVESIALANFLILVSSLVIVFKKEGQHG
ncbi:hypothetical protein RVV74_001405 [Enterobacter ludwigii]|nr:hypothetical protein [Enterobacter ludwigii]